MNILVFGANGKVGSLVVKKALSEGHAVTAFVHGSSSFEKHPNLSIHQGDIYDRVSVNDAVPGHDIVISCLGSWGTPKKDVLTRAMEHIIPALESNGITRIVSLTGADALAPNDSSSLIHVMSRSLLRVLAPKILADGENHIKLLFDSKLNWTVLRSPVMSNRGQSEYVLAKKRPMPWQTINRKAVAEAIYILAVSSDRSKEAPFITRL